MSIGVLAAAGKIRPISGLILPGDQKLRNAMTSLGAELHEGLWQVVDNPGTNAAMRNAKLGDSVNLDGQTLVPINSQATKTASNSSIQELA